MFEEPHGPKELRVVIGQEIIAMVIRDYKQHPFDINCGLCEDFALALGRLLAAEHNVVDSEELWLDELGFENLSHCILRVGDRYYDAEEPFGVREPSQLPMVQRSLRDWQ